MFASASKGVKSVAWSMWRANMPQQWRSTCWWQSPDCVELHPWGGTVRSRGGDREIRDGIGALPCHTERRQRGLTKVGTECSMWAGQRIDRDKNASWETKSSALTTFHRCILTRHHIGGNQKGDSEEKGLLNLKFNSIQQLLYWGMIQTRICAGNIVFILFCRAQFEPCHLFILENQIELIYRHQRNI